MQDQIVFIEIAHALVRPAFDVTAADIGVFRGIFNGDVPQRFEPVTSAFLSENSRHKKQQRSCPNSTENSTHKAFHCSTTSTRIATKECDSFRDVFHHHRLRPQSLHAMQRAQCRSGDHVAAPDQG